MYLQLLSIQMYSLNPLQKLKTLLNFTTNNLFRIKGEITLYVRIIVFLHH